MLFYNLSYLEDSVFQENKQQNDLNNRNQILYT